jgi:pimeloyl-ACP methyl ester carboxylesterase
VARAKGCFVWILRIFAVFVVLIIIALGIGFFLEQQAEIADAERYPVRGDLYEVNGRTMHLYCTGSGTQTVVLDAGLGGWSIDYESLQAELSTVARVCSYDRAGYGWSDAAESPRDAQAMVNDLEALLDAASISEPVILLGFSYSGLSSRLFTLQHPERVEALILLDPAHENDMSLYEGDLANQQQSLVGVYGFFGGLARFGIVRFLNPAEMAPYAPFIAQGKSEEYYAAVSAPQWWQTSQQEFITMIDGTSAAQVIAAGDLPDELPLVVIGAGLQPEGTPETIGLERRSSLESLASQSSMGQFILAEDTEHNEVLNRSDLVLAAIEPLLEAEDNE